MTNVVILQGRLTRDVEMRQTTSGKMVAKFSIATNSGFKDQNGEEQVTFTECTAWGKTAEFMSRYFQKGTQLIVEGELRNNNYTDRNGVKHYGMLVNVRGVSFCEKRSEGQPQRYAQAGYTQPQPQQSVTAQQAAAYSQIGYRQEAPQQYAQQPMQQQPQQFVQQAQAQGVNVQQVPDLSLDGLGDFEEIISDGDVPF